MDHLISYDKYFAHKIVYNFIEHLLIHVYLKKYFKKFVSQCSLSMETNWINVIPYFVKRILYREQSQKLCKKAASQRFLFKYVLTNRINDISYSYCNTNKNFLKIKLNKYKILLHYEKKFCNFILWIISAWKEGNSRIKFRWLFILTTKYLKKNESLKCEICGGIPYLE